MRTKRRRNWRLAPRGFGWLSRETRPSIACIGTGENARGPDGGALGAASGWDDGGVLQRRAPARVPEGARPGLRRRGVPRPPRARARLRSRSPSPTSSHARLPRTAQGFKHFSLHLRGREELLVTVHHRDSLVAGDTTDPDARFDRPPPVSDFLRLRISVRGFFSVDDDTRSTLAQGL